MHVVDRGSFVHHPVLTARSAGPVVAGAEVLLMLSPASVVVAEVSTSSTWAQHVAAVYTTFDFDRT
jgi:hypothetical protein